MAAWVHWPAQTSRDDYGAAALEQAFASLGYEACSDERLEPGFEKVAIYGYGFFYTHAARQLPDGKWSSKLGKAEDIQHDSPEDVADLDVAFDGTIGTVPNCRIQSGRLFRPPL